MTDRYGVGADATGPRCSAAGATRAPAGRRPLVRVYHRDGCHLCDVLLAAVEALRDRYTFELETVDIDEDPVLLARFNVKVPVVEVDGDILCCHRLDDAGLIDALSEAQGTGASRV